MFPSGVILIPYRYSAIVKFGSVFRTMKMLVIPPIISSESILFALSFLGAGGNEIMQSATRSLVMHAIADIEQIPHALLGSCLQEYGPT